MTLQDKLNWIMGIKFEEGLDEVMLAEVHCLAKDYIKFCENNPIERWREQYNLNVQGIQETCAIFDLAWHPYVDKYKTGVQEGGFDNSHLHE